MKTDTGYWIELNKVFGYQKVALCYHSFLATPAYSKLLEKHKEFVQVYHLKSFPNLVKGRADPILHVYYKSFNDVHWLMTVPFEMLIYNECYMDNFNKLVENDNQ